jgi:hypothetical protein
VAGEKLANHLQQLDFRETSLKQSILQFQKGLVVEVTDLVSFLAEDAGDLRN